MVMGENGRIGRKSTVRGSWFLVMNWGILDLT